MGSESETIMLTSGLSVRRLPAKNGVQVSFPDDVPLYAHIFAPLGSKRLWDIALFNLGSDTEIVSDKANDLNACLQQCESWMNTKRNQTAARQHDETRQRERMAEAWEGLAEIYPSAGSS